MKENLFQFILYDNTSLNDETISQVTNGIECECRKRIKNTSRIKGENSNKVWK